MSRSVKITASTWRKLRPLIDGDTNTGASALSRRLGTNLVRVKNSSGVNVNRFSVLGIANTLIDPESDAFVRDIVLDGDTPSAAAHAGGRFVICAEPITNNAIGRAYAAGVTVAQITVINADDGFADIDDGQYDLKSAAEGPCSILWKEDGTGSKAAILRFGAGGGMAPAGGDVIWAQITQGLQYPDPEGDPPEGSGTYFIAVELPAWEPGTYYPGDEKSHNDDNWRVKDTVDPEAGTTEEPGTGDDWETLPGIQPKHLDFGSVSDWRHFAPWYLENSYVPVIKRGSDYYFAQQMLRVKTVEHQSLAWNDIENRLMAVYG